MLTSCFLSHFVEFCTGVAEKTTKMSLQSEARVAGHLGFPQKHQLVKGY